MNVFSSDNSSLSASRRNVLISRLISSASAFGPLKPSSQSDRPQARYCGCSPFPPALLRTPLVGFQTRRSPVLIVTRDRVSICPVLALSISDTSLFICSKHLPGFALWTTFSSSLVRRYSHDYYPGSVTIALSGF